MQRPHMFTPLHSLIIYEVMKMSTVTLTLPKEKRDFFLSKLNKI